MSIGIEAIGDPVRFKQSIAVDRRKQRRVEQCGVDRAGSIGGEFAADRLHIGVDPVSNFDHVVGERPDVGAVGFADDARHPQHGEPRDQCMMGSLERDIAAPDIQPALWLETVGVTVNDISIKKISKL